MHKVLVILRKEFRRDRSATDSSVQYSPAAAAVCRDSPLLSATRRQWVESQCAARPVPPRVDAS